MTLDGCLLSFSIRYFPLITFLTTLSQMHPKLFLWLCIMEPLLIAQLMHTSAKFADKTVKLQYLFTKKASFV